MPDTVILVEHSGYELENLGDTAMLASTVSRLRNLMPGARILVISSRPDVLSREVAGAECVRLPELPRWLFHNHPRFRTGYRKIAKDLSAALAPILRRRATPQSFERPGILSLSRAVGSADLVVAAGGGYVNDLFAIHGRGVLRVLRAAQRMHTPTAMLGQGVGPLRSRTTRRLLARVLPRLDVLTLREGRTAPPLIQRLSPGVEIAVSGDDAISLGLRPPRPGSGLGVNIRIARYANTDGRDLDIVRSGLAHAVQELNSPTLVALPISSAREDDLGWAKQIAPVGSSFEQPTSASLSDLVTAIGLCRVVVTGSYHAGVFALAHGVPVVALSHSEYYDGKFEGLAALYPAESVQVVQLSREAASESLASAVFAAWRAPDAHRLAIFDRSAELVRRQEHHYSRLRVATSRDPALTAR